MFLQFLYLLLPNAPCCWLQLPGSAFKFTPMLAYPVLVFIGIFGSSA